MSITADYFLLYHGVCIAQNSADMEFQTNNRENFLESCSLILSVNRKNFDKFSKLATFCQIIQSISSFKPTNIQDMHYLQSLLIKKMESWIKNSEIDSLHESLNYLYSEEVISYEEFGKLSTLFSKKRLIKQEKIIQIQKSEDLGDDKYFQNTKANLQTLMGACKEYLGVENKDRLSEVEIYLANQEFSIGVTGIINSGKSTMLNAILSSDILGTSMIPETANLSILRYGKTKRAKVHFWNENEWSEIQKSANELTSMQAFVKQTHSTFKDSIATYIQKEGKVIDIGFESLHSYTSAEDISKKCNLVKAVELYSDLKFLQDGISIVDTPGLDDPVIQREEITKKYLSQCDMLIHLMNVKQCATSKDVEFIIDALLYQNISRLVVVITRMDSVSQEELVQVIDYSKQSIIQKLRNMDKSSQIEEVINAIEFIPISGKNAMIARLDKNSDIDIEQTGITKLEEFLNQMLFSKDSIKSSLIINTAKQKLRSIIQSETQALEYSLYLYSKSSLELESELQIQKERARTQEQNIINLQSSIKSAKDDMKEFEDILKHFVASSLLTLKDVIKRRVYDDISYALEKKSERPTSERLSYIVENGIKDGIIDIVRDYRYKFMQKAGSLLEALMQKYKDIGIDTISHESFDVKEFLKNEFESGFLVKNNQIMLSKINTSAQKVKKSSLDEFSKELELFIKDGFFGIEKSIFDKVVHINEILSKKMDESLQKPLEIASKMGKSQIQQLQSMSENISLDEVQKTQNIININEKLENLQKCYDEIA